MESVCECEGEADQENNMQPDDAMNEMRERLTDPAPIPVPVARATEELAVRERIQNMRDELMHARETANKRLAVAGTLAAFCASPERLQEVARVGVQVGVQADKYGDPAVEIVIPGCCRIEVIASPNDDIRYRVDVNESRMFSFSDICDAIKAAHDYNQ